MPNTLVFSICLLALTTSCQNSYRKAEWKPGEPLFPIIRNDRWGFINRSGAEVIEPKFRNIGHFTDSLTAARENGAWGFINPKGEFIIPPIYDYVQGFSEGYAAVWKAGVPFFINIKGEKALVLPDSTLRIGYFENGQVEIWVIKNGVRDNFFLKKDGSIQSGIAHEATQHPAVISREVPVVGEKHTRTEYAVQDSNGKILVPFGKYTTINPFKNGFAEIIIEKEGDEDYYTGFIHPNGQLAFMLPKGAHVFENYFSDGLLAVRIRPNPDSDSWSPSDDFITWYDTTGKVIFVKREDHDAMEFKDGRTFTGEIRNWYLMDKNGRQLGNNRFEWVAGGGDFSDNLVVVAAAKNGRGPENLDIDFYGAIDSMGNYVIPPQFNHVHDAGFQKEGHLVAVNEPIRKEHYGPEFQRIKKYWGLIDRKGNWIFEPKLTEVSPDGYQNGLLYAEMDSLYGYVDAKGKFVWSAVRKKEFPNPEALNVDVMLRAYCYGFASDTDQQSGNHAVPNAHLKGFPKEQPGIVVRENEKTKFEEQYQGMKAYVYNTGQDTLEIDVQDNRLYMLMQALNAKGEWQNIEYSPSSWCGNSYYKVRLNPDEYWAFDIPVYDGDFPTTLRLAFTWQRKWVDGSYKTQTIYSNTFPGKVNPGQFWREQGYSANNIMDPYNN